MAIKSLMQRIIRVLDEIDALKADSREIYAEAKSHGYDKTALGLAIRTIRNRDKAESAEAIEREAIAALYIAEFDAPSHVHTRDPAHVRESAAYPSSGQ